MDADMVVLRAPNELLKMDTHFAAVPDIGWPDCFNSGMMVLNPNMGDYFSLLALAQRGISFDGADQGLLNMHFRDWERLSFAYNCTPSGNYQYVPAYRHFQSSINAVHFIGRDKPWILGRENRFNHGVYGELMGMWWSVYDRHYHPQSTTYVSEQSVTGPKKVQDYVRGEETIYLPEYSRPSQQSVPAVVLTDTSEELAPATSEQPMGDAASPATNVVKEDFEPTPTVEQRRFSAPYAEWDPSRCVQNVLNGDLLNLTRAPPPTNSKPEASNFPTEIYDMSHDTKLFQPPSHYPDAPKDMWYQVPEKAKEVDKPKPIFPWEGRAPKPTRVFAEPRAPTPPPEPPAATTTEVPVAEPGPPQPIQSPDPWASFQARTNAWDDVPEIERYMQSIQRPRKGKIQVLHQSTPQGVTSPPGRKPSMRLTDFPTEDDRPSLPVTPAPVRRPSFWGSERDEEGNFPAAEGVPQQDEWVRQFSSYPVPDFRALSPLLRNVNGVLVARCQHCGKQNPIAKLEELQRKQSEVLIGSTKLEETADLPARKMPGSASREAVEEATNKAISPEKSPKQPLKPILKQPTFQIPAKEQEAENDVSRTDISTTAALAPGVDPQVDTLDPKSLAAHVEDSEAPASQTAPTMTAVST